MGLIIRCGQSSYSASEAACAGAPIVSWFLRCATSTVAAERPKIALGAGTGGARLCYGGRIMRGSDVARQQPSLDDHGGRDETAGRTPAGERLRWEGIHEELASRISRLEAVLADAAAAAASMRELLDPLDSLSRFIKDLEISLKEVRGAFEHSQAPVSVAPVAPLRREAPQVVPAAVEEAWVEEREVSPEPGPPAAQEAWVEEREVSPEPGPPAAQEAWVEEREVSPEPGPSAAQEAWVEEQEVSPEPGPSAASTEEAPAREEERGPESAPSSEPRPGQPVLLRFESSEGYIDLMTVDRVLRETPGIADLELAQYEGKNATIRVWLAGEGGAADNVIQETVQGIKAGFQKHASGVRVEFVEGQEED
jgi:hypothetical protein